MAIINTNGSFGPTDTVTNTNLNAVADGATFNDPVDEETLELHTDGKLRVKAGGVDTTQIADSAVNFSKLTDVNDDDTMSNASATTLATSESIKAYVDSSRSIAIIESDTAGARDGSTYYFNNLSETIDIGNIVSESSGEITFSSTGTYLIDISGSFVDSNGSSSDVYDLTLTSGTSSINSLLNQAVRYDSSYYRPISIKYVRTVTNTTTDKLAIYVSPISGASSELWQASDVVIKITKLT